MRILQIIWLSLGFVKGIYAQTGSVLISPLSYQVPRTSQLLRIDGQPEKAWDKAEWSSYFVDIEGAKKPIPLYNTRLKMMWDENHLYILAEMEEPDLWATLLKRDAIIYHDADFEVFLDPNNDQQQYFEYEINALGTVMDLFMDKPYKKGGRANLNWNSTNLRTAVSVKGTLNDNRDRDSGWMVEMAIPFKDLERPGRISRPQAGSAWRINFSRVQWLLVNDGQSYQRQKSETGKILPEFNWVWSPQGVIDMHQPQYWGFIHFKD